MPNLFTAAADRKRAETAPLAERMRPRTLDEFVGQEQLLGPGRLLPHVERCTVVLFGATTENPSFEVIAPLLSRSRVVVLNPLGEDEMRQILEYALSDGERGLGTLGLELGAEARDFLIATAQGD